MNKQSKILIVGQHDVMEKSLCQYLEDNDYQDVVCSSQIGLNATIQTSLFDFFARHKPAYVFLLSVTSGGIQANQNHPADFIYQNLASQNNVIYASHKFGVKKLLFVASSCIYPKNCAQPIKEECFLTGKMEETSEPYSIAKAAGITLCQSYRKQYGLNTVVMVPATVYGPDGDMDLEFSHVIGALMMKFAEAVRDNLNEVSVWGTGNPRREFLYKDDFVSACMLLMEKYDQEGIINVGCGYDVSIKELAQMIAKVVGFKGDITYDTLKPDGVFLKLLDNSRIKALGWKEKIDLLDGIEKTWRWYKEKRQHEKGVLK